MAPSFLSEVQSTAFRHWQWRNTTVRWQGYGICFLAFACYNFQWVHGKHQQKKSTKKRLHLIKRENADPPRQSTYKSVITRVSSDLTPTDYSYIVRLQKNSHWEQFFAEIRGRNWSLFWSKKNKSCYKTGSENLRDHYNQCVTLERHYVE